MLSVLVWLLTVAGLLVLALLVVPFQVRADGQVGEGVVTGELRARWGFGLIGVRLSSRRSSGLTICGLRVARFGSDDGDAKKKKKNKKKKDKKPGRRGACWTWAHRHALQRVARRMLATLAPRLEVRGQVGLGDPLHTALASVIVRELERLPSVDLAIGWDYLDDIVELEGRARARLWLLHVAGVALALFIGDRDVRALLRAPA